MSSPTCSRSPPCDSRRVSRAAWRSNFSSPISTTRVRPPRRCGCRHSSSSATPPQRWTRAARRSRSTVAGTAPAEAALPSPPKEPVVFNLPDSWVWDFWFADDGDRYHVFFLYASRALHDPERRHLRASIGHAVSDDLMSWTQVADALVRSDAPAFDDVATWTGSVVRHDDGTWFLYYTGVRFEGGRNVQRLGYATSADLTTWTKAT